jgi:hypothetical protein
MRSWMLDVAVNRPERHLVREHPRDTLLKSTIVVLIRNPELRNEPVSNKVFDFPDLERHDSISLSPSVA